MARHCIGLDIGSTAIKLVQLRTGRAGLALENFGVAPVPAGAIAAGAVVDADAVVGALRGLTARIGLRGKDVALAVSGNGVIIKRISVPQLEPAAFAQQIEWEARQLVSPPSRDDVLIDHTRLRQNPMTGEVEVLLVAAKRDLVQQLLRVVGDAGLRPVVVDATAFRPAKLRRGRPGVHQRRDLRGRQRRRRGLDDQHHRRGHAGLRPRHQLRRQPLHRGAARARHERRGCRAVQARGRGRRRGRPAALAACLGGDRRRDPAIARLLPRGGRRGAAVAHRPDRRLGAGARAAAGARPARARAGDPARPVRARPGRPRRVDLAVLRSSAPAAAVAFGLALRSEDDGS